MTQNEEIKTVETGFLSTKIGKVLLTVLAVALTFAGPTYVIYVLVSLAKIDLAVASIAGFILFVIGLLLMRFLMQKKIIT